MEKPVPRRASRLILLDPQRRILLLRHAGANGAAFWAPPGGGLEGDETFEEAAIREAEEELGMSRQRLKRLWERTADFVFTDHPVTQHEWFFLIEGDLPTITSETWKVHIQEGILEVRWWTTKEIDLASEPIFPEDLASKIKQIST